MRKLGILSYVDYVSGRDPKLRIKPHPDQVILCLKKLKCNPEHSVMIGDNIADLRSAKAAGITFTAVITGRVPRTDFESEKADYIIQNLDELPQILQKLFRL
jgi:phosphoglycolate phosphatase-like HAD superfamily hydrolase